MRQAGQLWSFFTFGKRRVQRSCSIPAPPLAGISIPPSNSVFPCLLTVYTKTGCYCFHPPERQLLLSSHSLNGMVLRKHRTKDSRNYKCGSTRRALKWEMPASSTVRQNSQIDIYFSAEEKMNGVLGRDGKFISTPHRESGRGGRGPG